MERKVEKIDKRKKKARERDELGLRHDRHDVCCHLLTISEDAKHKAGDGGTSI